MHKSNQKLAEFNIRPTKQRLDLAEVLFAHDEPRHFTAESIFQEALEQGYHISQATVYNCLHLFCQAGLIREIAVKGQKSFYDTRTDEHPHFYRAHTGKLEDAPVDFVKVEILGDAPKGTQISAVDIVIRLEDEAPKN